MSTKRNESATVKVVPVVETIAADLLTPLAVYLALSDGCEHSFLFESVEGGESLARYSFIGAGPFEIHEGGESAFRSVQAHLNAHETEFEPDLPPFVGGAVGFLGFGACEWFEPAALGSRGEGNDLCAFMLVRSIAAFDHAKQIIKLVSLAFVGPATDEEQEISLAEARNRSMREKIEGRILPPTEGGSMAASVSSNWNRPGFEGAVSDVKERIAAGGCYQVVLSQRFEKPTNASPVSIYRALRRLNPSPYMFLMRLGEKSIIGASPEMLVRCKDGALEYRPIAGTRIRGGTPAEDERLAAEMSDDEKETAEHMMLVDLGRNDLGRVCEYGTVRVDSLKRVEKYSHVQHLVSSLSGTLRRGLNRFDALGACFPAGTVSGAPKIKAIEVLRELEPTPRGVYAGAVGYFDYAGNMDTCIAIRTIELSNGLATIQAGAGIVADSRPDLEFEETINKARVLLRAIEIAEEGRV
jgi:anthranilate synthase component 1